MTEGRLGYNDTTGRYGILASDLWIKDGLHCGDVLEMCINGEWIQTRMKMTSEQKWCLVGIKYCGKLENIRVRIE